jgi:proteasome accessory factor B
MQKAQRLLDLAALLLRAAEPVSWRDIQELFPEDYGGSEEASIRKFERDKAELLELGIPVRYLSGDEDLPAGYLIDKDDFYLPDLKLPPEHLALLYLAGSAALAGGAFPYARDLAHAMSKLSFAARAAGTSEVAAQAAERLGRGEGEAEPGRGAGVARTLEQLSQAVGAHKRVHLVYEGAERRLVTERDVDPYGLFQKGGAWFVVGHCHLRRQLRTFHLGRVRSLLVNPAAPRTPDFAPPPAVRLVEHATREPWEFAQQAPLACRVRLEPPVAPETVTSFGPRARVVEEERGSVVVELSATNPHALVRHVLSLDRAEILAPRELRQEARQVLTALARRVG